MVGFYDVSGIFPVLWSIFFRSGEFETLTLDARSDACGVGTSQPRICWGSALELFKLAKSLNFPIFFDHSAAGLSDLQRLDAWLRKNHFFKHRVFNKLGGACNNICLSLFAGIIQLYRYFTTCRSCVSFFAAQTCCAGVVLKNVASIGKHREAHCIVVSIVRWDWQARPLPLVNVDGSCETILYKQKKVQLLFNKGILQQCEGNPWWNIFIYLPL